MPDKKPAGRVVRAAKPPRPGLTWAGFSRRLGGEVWQDERGNYFNNAGKKVFDRVQAEAVDAKAKADAKAEAEEATTPAAPAPTTGTAGQGGER